MRQGIAMMAAAAVLAGCATSATRDELVTPEACAPLRYDIYFATDQAELTPTAAEAVRMSARQLAGCRIDRVRVLGLADASGDAVANQALSERRALAVTAALEAAGLPAPAFEVRAAGDAGAVTGDGANAPVRRRTEVLIEARAR